MKDWLDDIQDKLGDFEMKAPEGLWARIEASQGVKAPAPRWGRWMAMAGSAAAAVLAAALLFRNGNEGKPGIMVPEAGEPAARTVIADLPQLTGTQAMTGKPGPTVMPTPEAGTDPDQGTMSLEAGTMVPDCPDISSERTEGKPDGQSSKPDERESDMSGDWNRLLAPVRTKNRGSMGIGIRSSYSSGSSDLLAMAGSAMAAAGPGENVAWEDSPALGMMLFNRGAGQAEYTHRMPVRVGLMLDWQSGRRWSVESGVSFTRLCSTVRQGDDRNYTRTLQKLDYIGIPLNFRYLAFDTGKFGVYLSAGAGIDKCVSARNTGSYSFTGMTGTEKGSLGTEKIEERPLQFMVNASAGASWAISSMISLYAEPGLAWYADDGSSLHTIYKERPMNFCLDFGLRFTLGVR